MTLMYVAELEVSEDLKTALNKLESIYNYRQAIVDIAYKNLEVFKDPDSKSGTYSVPHRTPNQPWRYSLLTGVTFDSFGPLAEFAVLISKYEEQVCIGGHLQYWYNNYASDFDRVKDLYLHWRLRSYYDCFIDEVRDYLNLSEEDWNIVLQADTIMKRFQDQLELYSQEVPHLICDDKGDLYQYESDSDNYGEPTEWCKEHWEYLDRSIYKIRVRLSEILDDYFREKIVLGKIEKEKEEND